MTTIAYRDGIMASDSRCADEQDMHLTNCQKMYTLKNGSTLGTAGDDDARPLMKLLGRKQLPSRKKLAQTEVDFKGILVLPDLSVYIVEVGRKEEEPGLGEWYGMLSEITDTICAVGTGSQFAYGAMEAGKTAAEAVEIACKRDINSALPVQELEIKGETIE